MSYGVGFESLSPYPSVCSLSLLLVCGLKCELAASRSSLLHASLSVESHLFRMLSPNKFFLF